MGRNEQAHSMLCDCFCHENLVSKLIAKSELVVPVGGLSFPSPNAMEMLWKADRTYV